MAAKVTVAIPVYNGARYLDEVLGAVRAQQVDREVELLIIDSGSTDGSLEIAERHGARIHRSPRPSSRTAARATSPCSSPRATTSRSSPRTRRRRTTAGSRRMLDGFAQADDVALVFGPHDPRPDASHMIKCEMERHFATLANGAGVDIQRIEHTGPGMRAYRAYPGRWTFFSDVNGAVAKWAWERFPYRSVPYAEDQLLGREVVEAGLAKVFHPEARVVHSHDYPPLQFFRRYFDEFRSLREVLGHVEALGWRRTPMTIRGLIGHDKRWLRRQGVRGTDLVVPLRDLRAPPLPAPDGRHRRLALGPPATAGAQAAVARRPRDVHAVGGRGEPAAQARARARLEAGRGRRRLDLGLRPPRLPGAPGGDARALRLDRAAVDDRLGRARLAHRLGRPHHDLPADPPARAARPQVRDLPVRSVQPRQAPRRRAASGDPRALRADRRAGLPRARRLQRRRHLRRHGVLDGVPGPRPPELPREGLPRPGPRGGVLRDLGRVPVGGGDLPHGLPLHRLHAVDGRPAARSATGRRRAGSSAAPTSTRSATAARRGASPAWSPSTRARRPSAAPCRWR